MKLKLKNTPEQVELIKAMGSRDSAVAAEASQAFSLHRTCNSESFESSGDIPIDLF